MSAPLSPAACTATSSSPEPGSGSGCSSTVTCPSLIVAARIWSDPIDDRASRHDTGCMLRRVLLAAGGEATLASPASADVTSAPRSTWIRDGEVKAVALSGQTAFVGGNFGRIAPYTGGSVRIDSSTAAAKT